MRAILMCVCVVTLAFAGCGDSDSGSSGSGGSAGSGGTPGSGGSGGSGGNVDGTCQQICESPCIGEILNPDELAACIEGCEMGGIGFDECLPELAAALECLERVDCVEDFSCLDEFEDYILCLPI